MNAVTTASGLGYDGLAGGEGTPCGGRSRTASASCPGWPGDGTRFDSGRDRERPFSFPADRGYGIPGRDDGVQGVRVRGLTVPAELAFHERGAGGVMPAGARPVCGIELLEISG